MTNSKSIYIYIERERDREMRRETDKETETERQIKELSESLSKAAFLNSLLHVGKSALD